MIQLWLYAGFGGAGVTGAKAASTKTSIGMIATTASTYSYPDRREPEPGCDGVRAGREAPEARGPVAGSPARGGAPP